MSYHLAQLNVARLLYDLEDARIDEFRNNLDRINALAESIEGFVWRLKETLEMQLKFQLHQIQC